MATLILIALEVIKSASQLHTFVEPHRSPHTAFARQGYPDHQRRQNAGHAPTLGPDGPDHWGPNSRLALPGGPQHRFISIFAEKNTWGVSF
jgi:hypothetical protein